MTSPGLTRPRAVAAGWTDPAFARVASAVHLVSGLVFPPNRQPSAESGMRRAMTALRLRDPAALAHAVARPGEARDAVLAELTVGETYFFRESAQLDLLATEILPALVDRRNAGAPLRVWSAGCASGEEPYTIAMLLREQHWPHPARILGTDVARPRLEAARRGHFTRWSLRGVAQARIERWFERRASHFLLHQEIREAVTFAPLNLIADEYPTAEGGTATQDLVLCRNVLIYFDMDDVARITTRLLAALAPDGWLLLGASDPPLTGLVDCEPVMTPGGLAYRRADRAPAPHAPAFRISTDRVHAEASARGWATRIPQAAPSAPVGPPASVPAAPPGAAATTSVAAAPADHAAVTDDADDADAWVARVRALADAGRLREADALCAEALDAHRMVPELHLLHAMLLAAAGQWRESANAARRATYLEPGFVMAHLQLGDALARAGDPARARQVLERVLALLEGWDDGRPVPAGDGAPASRLRETAARHLRVLAGRLA